MPCIVILVSSLKFSPIYAHKQSITYYVIDGESECVTLGSTVRVTLSHFYLQQYNFAMDFRKNLAEYDVTASPPAPHSASSITPAAVVS